MAANTNIHTECVCVDVSIGGGGVFYLREMGRTTNGTSDDDGDDEFRVESLEQSGR